MNASQAWNDALDGLATEGLNWVAFVDGHAGPRPPAGHVGDRRGLLLFVALGSTFGARTDWTVGSDPFDQRSIEGVMAFARDHLLAEDAGLELVYPGSTPIDLVAWLKAGRVQHTSRLGTGIRPDCGPWLAVRAALWVDVPEAFKQLLAVRYPPLEGASPCQDCSAPCQVACPADALARPDQLERCVEHRLRDRSSCAAQCLARSACPVGAEHRYPPAQQSYHYGISLQAIRRWKQVRT